MARKGRPFKEHPPLTDEQRKLCPYGEDNCRICQLDPSSIEDIHNRRFKAKYAYDKIRKYIKETYGLGEDYTRLGRHFNQHVLGKERIEKVLTKKKDVQYPEIVKALAPMTQEVKISTNKDIENAYSDLVKMAGDFTRRVSNLQTRVGNIVDERLRGVEFDNEVANVNVLDMLEKMSKINKEARDFVKEISALRAPKVMVAQFLEAFIDSVIKEMSIILSNMAADVKFSVDSELTESGHPNLLSENIYANLFRDIAMDYRDRMVNLKRQQLSDALSALNDLEKII